MKRLTASILAIGLAATGVASAQTPYGSYDRGYDGRYDQGDYGYRDSGAVYDYARVVRVRPVFDGYAGTPASAQRCYQRRDDYAGGYGDDGYYDEYGRDRGGYARDGRYYGNGYGNDAYRRDGYGGGTQAGRNVATVIGGLVGAAIGSQVGGGSARYATAAVGTMVGGMAGQKVYEESVRSRAPRGGTVTVCDPVPAGDYRTSRGVESYDVTYEYGGRQYTARTGYHPGDRIRVRVDVRPE